MWEVFPSPSPQDHLGWGLGSASYYSATQPLCALVSSSVNWDNSKTTLTEHSNALCRLNLNAVLIFTLSKGR